VVQPAVPPDFGKAGKRTVRRNEVAATIKASVGEFIHCEVTVVGTQAEFAFACRHRPIKSAADFAPGGALEWDFFKNGGDADAAMDEYALVGVFLQARKYTFVMEHCDAQGSVLATLKDLDFESTDSTDVFRTSITLLSK
jgi:hypothetical protein